MFVCLYNTAEIGRSVTMVCDRASDFTPFKLGGKLALGT